MNSLNKTIRHPKKITILVSAAIILASAVVSISILFLLLRVDISASPGLGDTVSGSQFKVCPLDPAQPACYLGDSPTPIIRWDFLTTGDYPCPAHTPNCGGGPSTQVAFGLVVDDDDEPTGNFPSPVVAIIRNSPNNFYMVPVGILQFNTTYYWKVAVTDNYGSTSGWTCGDAFTTSGKCPPPQPTNLTAILVTCSQIDLSWDDVDYEDGYKIERKEGAAGVWSQIYDTGAPDITTYSDTDPALTEGNTYYYRVAAYNIGGETWSDEASVEIPLCIPTAFNLGVTPGGAATYCTLPARHYFSWTYTDNSITGLIDGDKQTKYQLQVDNNSDFSSPEYNSTVNIGAYPCPNETCDNDNNTVIVVVCDPVIGMLDYNTRYYWQVMVWDSSGLDSGWVPYNDPADSDGDGNPETFTTEMHRYPAPYFIWTPQEPSAGEAVLFTDQSACYEVIGCKNPIACTGSWLWTFEDGDPATSNEQNPITIFDIEGLKQTTLEVIDADGYGPCQISSSTDIGTGLPGWREVLPR